MKIRVNWKKGVNIAIMAISIFYLSGFGVFVSPSEAQAVSGGTEVKWVQVDGQGAVHVAPGATINLSLQVKTSGSGSNDNWHSTAYKIEGGNWVCVNTPNYNNDGTYTESFDITAPAIAGKYDLWVKAFQDDNCTGGNDDKKLPNAIFVNAPDTTIEAQKVICDAEEYLPNGQVDKPITAETAQDWVDQSEEHCWLAKDWDFEWWTSDTNPTAFSVSSPAVVPTEEGIVKIREIRPSDYIPFSNDNEDNISAEIYCGNDAAGYDNEEWFGTKNNPLVEGETYQCVAFNAPKTFCGDGIQQDLNDYEEAEQCDGEDGDLGEHQICNQSCQIEDVPYCGDGNTDENLDEQCDGERGCIMEGEDQCTWDTATLTAQKVVCDVEYDAEHENWGLPNWGTGGPNITQSTAQDWVDNSEGHCKLVEWDFQWAPNGTSNPGDNTGEAGGNWTTFSGSIEVPAFTDKIWVREVWSDKYVPFTYNTNGNNSDSVSAELYCNNDVLNYDNYDWITNFQPGEDYYCVGWNVSNEGTVTFHKDVRWNNDKVDIDDNTAFGVKVGGDYKGDISENSPLELTLQVGNYSAEEVIPGGYESIVGTADFTVLRNQNVDVYFENKTMCKPGEGWAYSVKEYTPGAGSIAANRLDPLAALGPADGNASGTFVSLGQGGTLTVQFEHSIIDGIGDDISVHETTNGNWPEETALVEVSYDGNTWYELGTASNHNLNAESYFDLASVSLPVAKYVRLTDTTDVSLHDPNTDGFDVDAIDMVYGTCEDVAPSYIQGKKFNDFNYDGVKNNGDYFMDGWTINLYKEVTPTEWGFVKSMETGSDITEAGNVAIGQYRFTNLYPGTYFICEVQKDGWYQTRPTDKFENLSENAENEAPNCFKAIITDNGQKRTGRQFGNAELLNLHGYKWHDVNGNGIRDCAVEPDQNLEFQSAYIEELPELPRLCQEFSEELLSNWTIFIDDNSNGAHDQDERSTQTDESGMYFFDGLEAGTYRICEVNQEGWEQTHPLNTELNNCHMVTVPQEQESFTEYNFGNRTQADLEITKAVLVNGEESETANEGDTLSYTITVANNGDTMAYGLYVEDTTPTNTTLVEHSGDLDSASFNGSVFTWGPFDLAGNSSTTFTFDVTVNEGLPVGETSIENQATLWQLQAEEESEVDISFFNKLLGIKTANAAEPTLLLVATSNLVVTTVTIAEQTTTPEEPKQGIVLGETTDPVLSIEKTANVEFTTPGSSVEYTIVVTNTGEGQALNLVLTDTLPAGFTFDDASSTKTWNLGALAVGASKTVVYTASVGQDLEAGGYINTATTSASNHDPVTTTHELELRIPKVLGATVPDTGASTKDYIVFIASILLIGFGTYLFNREKFVKVK